MKRFFILGIILLVKSNLYSQTEGQILDSINSLIRQHELHKGFETRIELEGNTCKLIIPPANQITSVSIFDVESVKCLPQGSEYSAIIYCIENKRLITDNNNGKISRWNSMGILFDSAASCEHFISLFRQLLMVKGVTLREESEQFKSDSLASTYRIKCLVSEANHCRYGIDTVLKGPLTLNYPNGDKRLDYFLDSGFFEGQQRTWYPNGQLESSSYYKKGLQVGEDLFYNEMGQLVSHSFYINGLQHGLYEEWMDNGIKILEETFYMGVLISQKTWTPNGELIDFITF